MKRVNLIPVELSWRRDPVFRKYAKYGIVILVLMFLIPVWQRIVIIRKQMAIKKQKERIAEYRDRQERMSKVLRLKKEDRKWVNIARQETVQKIGLLKQSRQKRILWSKVLLELSQLVPKELKLTGISVSENNASIKGLSSSNIHVSLFMAMLDASEYYDKTSFRFIQNTSGDNPLVEFEIVTQLNLDKFRKLQ